MYLFTQAVISAVENKISQFSQKTQDKQKYSVFFLWFQIVNKIEDQLLKKLFEQ